MKQSLTIALIASLLIVLSHGETISKVSLPTLELRQLEDALESYEHVIVLFQDQEKIEKSQKYMTFMADVVVEMNEKYPNAYIGKFLVQDGHELPQYYKSSEYPAIVFFDKGKKNVYRGALDLENFVRWFSSMTATALINLKDQADFDKFLKSDNYPKLVAMYNDKSVDEIKLIEELVNEDSLKVFDIYKVALCIDDFCNLQYENVVFEKNSLALFRHFDNVEPVALKRRGLDDKLDILEFINKEALPPVVQFDAVNVTKLFAGYSPVQMILFVDPKADNQKVLQDFEASALYNRKEDLYYERVLHSVFQFDEEWEEIKTFFSKYDRSKLPTAFITEVTDDGIIKYEFKKEKVTFDSLREFIDDFRRKDLEKMIISEEVPDNEGKLINKLVGKTFKKEVVLSKENYVVLFCDKLDQQDCQTSMKLFEYVGEKLAEASLLESKNDSSTATSVKLKFGYIDMLKNEVEYRVFTRYPQILLYMKGKKNRPNEFDLPLTPRAFVAWLNTMITELELKLTDTEESTLVEEKYTEKEKEEYEEMKKKLEEQNRIVEEELAKIAAERAEQEQKEKEKAEVKMLEALQDDEDGPRHQLPLGGTIEIDLKPMMAAHAAREEKKAADAAAAAAAASKKAPKKKNEANIDL